MIMNLFGIHIKSLIVLKIISCLNPATNSYLDDVVEDVRSDLLLS